MLYVFVGDDGMRVRKEAHAFLNTFSEEHAERITADLFEKGMFADYAGGVSLFGGDSKEEAPVLLDFLSEDSEALESLVEYAETLKNSTRAFVVMDSGFPAAMGRTLKQHAEKYTEIEGGAHGQKFNTFSLADALCDKDKKMLWVLLMRARLAGVAGEEIAGVLFWQLKTLMLAEKTASAEEADVKSFPYQKAKRALKNFPHGEVTKLSERLLKVYHDGHAEKDMDIELERFVLML